MANEKNNINEALKTIYGDVFSQDFVKPGNTTISDLLSSKNVDTFKKKLSAVLVGTPAYPAVHGVGIGLLDNRECVRVFIDLDMIQEASDILQSVIGAKLPPDMGMSHQIPISSDITVEVVRARRSLLSTAAPSVSSRRVLRRKKDTAVHRCLSSREFYRLPAGISVWRDTKAKGTIGYFCEDDDDNRYLLTCNHVIADYASGYSLPRRRNVQRDGSGSNDVSIARLAEFVPLNTLDAKHPSRSNLVDAALASISSAIRPRIVESGTINGILRRCLLGVDVQKHGLATCLTDGKIDAIRCDMVVVGSNGHAYLFTDQIRVVPSGDSKIFASRGDSGALVYTKNGAKAVGLLFAAGKPDVPDGITDDFTHALVNPIGTVLKCLERRLISRHGSRRKNLRLLRTP